MCVYIDTYACLHICTYTYIHNIYSYIFISAYTYAKRIPFLKNQLMKKYLDEYNDITFHLHIFFSSFKNPKLNNKSIDRK